MLVPAGVHGVVSLGTLVLCFVHGACPFCRQVLGWALGVGLHSSGTAQALLHLPLGCIRGAARSCSLCCGAYAVVSLCCYAGRMLKMVTCSVHWDIMYRD